MWSFKNTSNYPERLDHRDCLSALGWDQSPVTEALAPARIDVAKEKKLTIGAWATHYLDNG